MWSCFHHIRQPTSSCVYSLSADRVRAHFEHFVYSLVTFHLPTSYQAVSPKEAHHYSEYIWSKVCLSHVSKLKRGQDENTLCMV